MKKILPFILGSICFLAFIFGCAQRPDGSCDILWTSCCFAVSFLAGWLLDKVYKPREGR